MLVVGFLGGGLLEVVGMGLHLGGLGRVGLDQKGKGGGGTATPLLGVKVAIGVGWNG